MIEDQVQYENTAAKRAELQQLVDKARAEPGESYARELTIQSLKRRINRLTEEMLRYTTSQTVKTPR
jgi:hypothetical protein